MRLMAYVMLLGWTMMLFPLPVWADGPLDGVFNPVGNRPTVHTIVESRPDGVYVQISVRGSVAGTHQGGSSAPSAGPTRDPGSSGTAAAASAVDQGRYWTDADGIHHEASDGQRIDLNYLPNVKAGIADGMIGQIGQRPGEFPYLLVVDGQFQGVIWIPANANVQFGAPPANPAPPNAPLGGNGNGADPYEVALDILDHLPMPPIQIRTNPALGLVAMPGWYWVEGYDGAPFGMARTVVIPAPPAPPGAPPAKDITFTVEVRVHPTSYAWDFGDGDGVVSQSLGKRYPAESNVQHTYEYTSLQFPNGFPVRLTIEFAAEFRVDGGPAQALPTIRREFATGYRVPEVQSVLTSR
ncbi:MAG: PKD domain-containing protein [Chloroflexi bacterium]|nr:PKD domain-containing protein [Chloroflexota bacterium]